VKAAASGERLALPSQKRGGRRGGKRKRKSDLDPRMRSQGKAGSPRSPAFSVPRSRTLGSLAPIVQKTEETSSSVSGSFDPPSPRPPDAAAALTRRRCGDRKSRRRLHFYPSTYSSPPLRISRKRKRKKPDPGVNR
jgi:hypothetical protein